MAIPQMVIANPNQKSGVTVHHEREVAGLVFSVPNFFVINFELPLTMLA